MISLILATCSITHPGCMLFQVAPLVFNSIFVLELSQESHFLDDVLPFLNAHAHTRQKQREGNTVHGNNQKQTMHGLVFNISDVYVSCVIHQHTAELNCQIFTIFSRINTNTRTITTNNLCNTAVHILTE